MKEVSHGQTSHGVDQGLHPLQCSPLSDTGGKLGVQGPQWGSKGRDPVWRARPAGVPDGPVPVSAHAPE